MHNVGAVPPVEASPVETPTDVITPTQLIPAQPLWSKLAAVAASIPIVTVPLVPPPEIPAFVVTPVMSPVHVV
jgi:hypothetical protein